MQRAFDLLDEVADAVERQSRLAGAEVARDDPKRLTGNRSPPADETAPQRLIDHLSKRPARAPHLGSQFLRHILIQRKRRPHCLDVN